MKIFNSLTGKKEGFVPLKPNKVTMYVCGPTVYDYIHIGNARSSIIYDIFYRVFKRYYSEVTYVRNITDVDDKIIARAAHEKVPYQDITLKYTTAFNDNMAFLNCLEPTYTPKATEEIPAMLNMVKSLIVHNHAYKAGHDINFKISSYSSYGQLSHRKAEDMKTGTRIEVNTNKDDVVDFTLWKGAKDDEVGWASEFGYGRPGWHLECSAMSTKYLGENFDIHGGGVDLKFPHHENEIAQSCCAFPGSTFAKYWLHNGFLTVKGDKMSKSENNFITVNDLKEQNYNGSAIRLALLTAHYRKPLNFSYDILNNAVNSLEKFYTVLADVEAINTGSDQFKLSLPTIAEECLQNDLNIPRYLALMFSLLHDVRDTNDDENKKKLAQHLFNMGYFIGIFDQSPHEWLQNHHNKMTVIPDDIIALATKREAAKKNKDYVAADQLRLQINEMGYIINDRADGFEIRRNERSN